MTNDDIDREDVTGWNLMLISLALYGRIITMFNALVEAIGGEAER
nr:hypothetical protein [Salmonella sp.]